VRDAPNPIRRYGRTSFDKAGNQTKGLVRLRRNRWVVNSHSA
jgi:hypothetical protein